MQILTTRKIYLLHLLITWGLLLAILLTVGSSCAPK